MAIRNLSRWVGHEVRLDELCDDLFNRWVMHLQSRYRPKTAKTRRANVLGVWQYAVDTDHVEPESEPGRVRIVKVPRPVPECWSMAELATLLEATRAEQFDRHMRNGVHLGRLLFAFVNVCYDTALRTQDMFDLRTEQITDDGILAVVQRKTQTGHVCRIRPATVEAVRATYPPNREFVFAWAYRRETFWNWWRELLIRAGLPTGRRNGPQKIRRSSATYLERVSPGMAGIHLGHLTPGLALRHYVNSAVAYEARPLPPAIVKGGGA
jgi:integrase